MKLPRLERLRRAVWANKWWIIASGFALANLENVVVNSGFFRIHSATVEYIYYFGGTSATAGLLAGIVLAVTFSKLKEYGSHRTVVIEAVPREPEGSFREVEH